eukprot:CAMPEP_0119046840 /NCGR_PEP_ID=MMETSP1177-20130426/49261_1 /TAXON_ID=2985 /ORGANISM="Ochromonas sp, Strain CCMP1899" /LENGTH=468 /DNA_ID=CAMNT_0007020551 /DNA_START=57 /DNA_END=1460 /DNA_ORIENTATION=-
MPQSTKPVVGIIYSEGESISNESKNLAFYLSGALVSTGHATVNLVGLQKGGDPCDLQKQHKALSKGAISFLPPDKCKVSSVKTIPVSIYDSSATISSSSSGKVESHLYLTHWNELQNCHVIIVTVNSEDTEACCAKLAEILPDSTYRVVVISLQRGMKNGVILKDGLKNVGVGAGSSASDSSSPNTDNTIAVVEGLVGFACVPVPSPTDTSAYYYACTLSSPKLMLERLNSDVATVAEGPVNLLDTLDLQIQFRKNLTPHAWGIVLFENLHCLNCVTGGDLRDTLDSRRNRLILALMVRETRETLLKTTKGGKWAPDLTIVAFFLSPWMFEMLLVMPLPFFVFRSAWYLLNLITGTVCPWGYICNKGVRSPGLCDLMDGRRTSAESHLSNITSAGRRQHVDTPMCQAILETVGTLENAVSSDTAHNNTDTGVHLMSLKGRMYMIDQAYTCITKDRWYGHASVTEFIYW